MSAERYTNPDQAERLREELVEREAEEEEKFAERLTTKQKLQQKLDEQTVETNVFDISVEFRKPGAGMQKRAIRIASKYEDQDEDDIPAEDAMEIVEFMTESLAELSTDPDLDEEFWDRFGFEELEGAFEEVLLSFGSIEEEALPPETREELEEFREE